MNIGEKIKQLRILNDLTQEELADRAELSKGFISQVERNITSLSIATLTDVLECLGTNLRDFFNEPEEEKVVFSSDDFFIAKNEDNLQEIQWIVPNAQKNSMEPIIITLSPGAETLVDAPHDGEEFGYLLKGGITLHIGKRKWKMKKGECFYFRALHQHFFKNNGAGEAVVLWVSTPPSF